MPVATEWQEPPGAGGLQYLDNVAVGPGKTGTPITIIKHGTVTVDLASVAAGAVTEVTTTITGVLANDLVILTPPTAGETAGLVVGGSVVSAADTVKTRVINGSAGTIDETSETWNYTWISFS